MSAGEVFLTATPAVAADIGAAAEWVRNNGGRVLQPHAFGIGDRSGGMPLACRAYLRQSLYLHNQALAEICEWDENLVAFNIEVLGMNPVPNSEFILKFGVKVPSSSGTTVNPLFQTSAIDAMSTAEEMINKIWTASNGIFQVQDVSVIGGNPYHSYDLVTQPADQHPDVQTHGNDPRPWTWLGQWHLLLTDRFNKNLVVEAVETQQHYMRGISQISCQPTFDVPTGRLILVRDVMGMTLPGPARAGVKIQCQYYYDCGYAAVALGYRQMYLDMESGVEFPDLGT
jgi:hypothetical protein